jgi:DNA-binding NarL/FixJ family response regulator
MSIKVAIVEDDARVRESLSVLINGANGFRCINAFPNAEAALRQISHDWPDVVVMDINLPNMSGIDCVAKLKEMHPAIQVVMLTSYEDNELIFESLMAGASGYLTKQTPAGEILDALAEVHRGGSPMSSSIARRVVQYFHEKRPREEKLRNEMADLSRRELEILTLLAKGRQYKEIAASLEISVETVRVHVRHIYEKLHVNSRTEAVLKFLGKGNPL